VGGARPSGPRAAELVVEVVADRRLDGPDDPRGSVVSTSGDGVLCRFASPARAVRCGLAILDELPSVGLTARIGVHTGEIEERRGDVAGVNVHVGARVAALARSGEVWITRTVRDLVAGSGLRFDDRGRHLLKGFDQDVELLAAVPG
jgi:class 3 adenylate cyclase